MKRIYLRGPMTGLPGLNIGTFRAKTTNLRAGGHTVTNPAELNPDGGTWNDCMRRDIAALMEWDAVSTLPGWEHSRGARLAEHLGMKMMRARDLLAEEVP